MTPQDYAKKMQAAKEASAKNDVSAEEYKKAIGKQFTDGHENPTILEYVPTMLRAEGPRQCFLVDFGHRNVKYYWPCKEFLTIFKPVESEPKA